MKKKNYIQPEVKAMDLAGEEQVMSASVMSSNVGIEYEGDVYEEDMEADVNGNRFGSLW